MKTIEEFVRENKIIIYEGVITSDIVDKVKKSIENWNDAIDNFSTMFGKVGEEDFEKFLICEYRIRSAKILCKREVSGVDFPEIKSTENIRKSCVI